MKTKKSLRVLVLALAVVMVFGVCSTAFAATTNTQPFSSSTTYYSFNTSVVERNGGSKFTYAMVNINSNALVNKNNGSQLFLSDGIVTIKPVTSGNASMGDAVAFNHGSTSNRDIQVKQNTTSRYMKLHVKNSANDGVNRLVMNGNFYGIYS